jgi:hypothetical protein
MTFGADKLNCVGSYRIMARKELGGANSFVI